MVRPMYMLKIIVSSFKLCYWLFVASCSDPCLSAQVVNVYHNINVLHCSWCSDPCRSANVVNEHAVNYCSIIQYCGLMLRPAFVSTGGPWIPCKSMIVLHAPDFRPVYAHRWTMQFLCITNTFWFINMSDSCRHRWSMQILRLWCCLWLWWSNPCVQA